MNENRELADYLRNRFLFTYNAAKAAMRAYAAAPPPHDPALFQMALEACYDHSDARVAYVRFLEENPQTPP